MSLCCRTGQQPLWTRTGTAREACLSRWEAVAAHRQVIELLGCVLSQPSGAVRRPVELALVVTRLKGDRIARPILARSWGIKASLGAPSQRPTGR